VGASNEAPTYLTSGQAPTDCVSQAASRQDAGLLAQRHSQEGALHGAQGAGAPAQPLVRLQALEVLLGRRQQRIPLRACSLRSMFKQLASQSSVPARLGCTCSITPAAHSGTLQPEHSGCNALLASTGLDSSSSSCGGCGSSSPSSQAPHPQRRPGRAGRAGGWPGSAAPPPRPTACAPPRWCPPQRRPAAPPPR
jgi:hypothetical protein